MQRKALVVERNETGTQAAVRTLRPEDLPDGDVEVEVAYSSLNYKDALAVTGRGKIIRGDFPFVPGIDLVGRVVASRAEAFREDDWVIQTGWGLGETQWGGFSRRQRVQAEHLVPLPEGLRPHDAMLIGTAGFTAMLSVMALEAHGVEPEHGEVVVTGASGGVGSFAVLVLAQAGYAVVASTGSASAHGYLRALGAARLIDREELGQGPRRPLDSARWAGAVDAVGGRTLAALLSTLGQHGCVAACGLAGGADLETTVFPFILRGITLAGIDSNTCPMPLRRAAWTRLAATLTDDARARIHTRTIPLSDVPAASEHLLQGTVQGRIVVDVQQDGE